MKKVNNQIIYGESSEYCLARQASLVIKHKYKEFDEQWNSKDIYVEEHNSYVKVKITYLIDGDIATYSAIYDKLQGYWSC